MELRLVAISAKVSLSLKVNTGKQNHGSKIRFLYTTILPLLGTGME
jgi:hypothetical protein